MHFFGRVANFATSPSRLRPIETKPSRIDSLPGLEIGMEILALIGEPLALGMLGLVLFDLMRLRQVNLRALKVKQKSKRTC